MSADGANVADDVAQTPNEMVANGDAQQPTTAEVVKYPNRGRFGSGFDARRIGNGRPRKLRDIEKMLNAEHRTVEQMREVFNRLRALALGETILVPCVTAQGELTFTCKLNADPVYMKLYLERLMGLPKSFDDEVDWSDAPSEFFEYLKRKLQGG